LEKRGRPDVKFGIAGGKRLNGKEKDAQNNFMTRKHDSFQEFPGLSKGRKKKTKKEETGQEKRATKGTNDRKKEPRHRCLAITRLLPEQRGVDTAKTRARDNNITSDR